MSLIKKSAAAGRIIRVAFLPEGGWSKIFALLAVLVSWYFNKSIGWAIVHYVLGWVYLFYALVTGKFAEAEWFDIVEFYLN